MPLTRCIRDGRAVSDAYLAMPWTGSVHGRAVRRNLENADKEV